MDNEFNFFGIIFLIILFIFILFVRLFQLTIVKGSYYRFLSENNRLKEILIEPKRGTIIDRKGFVIAKNLDPNLETPFEEIQKNQNRIVSKRIYEENLAVASIVGYRQLADQDDLDNDKCLYKIKIGDKVGKKGIEKIYDCQLRGISGKKLVETDALGKVLKTTTVIAPTDGKKLQLSLDLELQKKAYELIKDKKGAIIASIPKTGEILALVSSPSFDPQDFEDNNNPSKYFLDENKPLFNRATEGVYPPGSLFKLIVATAALEEKAIDEKTQFEDKGFIKSGSLTFGNWYYLQYGKTEGMVDVIKAIRRSNDIFFYLAGEKTGVLKIKKWAEIFGLGKKTGIGLDESEGLIPSPFWKETVIKDHWYTGDTYNLSIGQGYLQTTPLQMNMVTGVFANNGVYCQPKLLKNEKTNCQKLPISSKTLDLVKEGMRQACSTGGTGWPLFEFKVQNQKSKVGEKQSTDSANLIKIQTGCKTGTAESHVPSGIPHAWISVFAPYEAPEIVVTVLVEEGGQGSDVAGPIARDLLKAYFERKE
ncbi:MAG: penicillin-binding transpeptidase domain-containing protein [Microgenomates group bacterium]